jgi:saccharopine dehydrogenase (NAD+, L-lysine-forming)
VAEMTVLVVGAGGVGSAFAAIAQRRPAFAHVVLADVSLERAEAAVARLGEPARFAADRVDASDRAALVELMRRVAPDAATSRSSMPRWRRGSPTSTWR